MIEKFMMCEESSREEEEGVKKVMKFLAGDYVWICEERMGRV
jgi:hypothetical protein